MQFNYPRECTFNLDNNHLPHIFPFWFSPWTHARGIWHSEVLWHGSRRVFYVTSFGKSKSIKDCGIGSKINFNESYDI